MKTILKIHWVDSATYKEWYNYDEIKELIVKDENITSIGYLVFEDKDCIVIAQNIDKTSCSVITKIPKKSIIKRGKMKVNEYDL